jgi:hypothetical protein
VSPAAHAVDRRIHDLRDGHRQVVADLRELEADGTYAALLAGHGLSGVTASRVVPALARLADLCEGLEPLDRLLAEVIRIRSAGRLEDGPAIELMAHLNSPTIVVAAGSPPATEGAVTALPVSAQAVSAQTLIDALEGAVEAVRDLVAEVDAAWQDVQARREQAIIEADALAVELPRHRGLASARADLAALATLVAEDPLGAGDVLERAEAAIAQASGALDDAAALRETFAAARQTLDEIDAEVTAGRAALERSRSEVRAPRGLLEPVDPASVSGERGLRPWLSRLERRVDEGDAAAARQGLERWREVANQTLAVARLVAEANSGPSRRRQELHGLFRAALVKAGAAGRAEDPRLTEMADDVRRAFVAPCDLAAVEALVEAYLAELRQPSAPDDAAPAWHKEIA